MKNVMLNNKIIWSTRKRYFDKVVVWKYIYDIKYLHDFLDTYDVITQPLHKLSGYYNQSIFHRIIINPFFTCSFA